MMNNITELTRKDVLTAERNKVIEKLTQYEIDIHVLERTDPELQVGKRVAAQDANGNPMSFTAVSAKQMLAGKKEEQANLQKRMSSIDALMK
jgi:hypothetical protein